MQDVLKHLRSINNVFVCQVKNSLEIINVFKNWTSSKTGVIVINEYEGNITLNTLVRHGDNQSLCETSDKMAFKTSIIVKSNLLMIVKGKGGYHIPI